MDEREQSNTIGERTSESSSKKRPRKRHLYEQILQQMEFYFSDANLSRDRFLSQLLEQNKNVPLDVFLRFNKIRALTVNIEDIKKALGNSQLLEVTDDGKNVYRNCPVQKKENQDDCIIYVEQLPPDANHDWVIGIFSAYGKVEYVSIPKYKNRAAIKGFAFVEFDTPEAAKKALEAFGSVGCCLPPQIPPEELCSIATFEDDVAVHNREEEEDEGQSKQQKKQKRIKQSSCENAEDTYDTAEQLGYHHLEDSEIAEPKSKKLKADVDEQCSGEKQKKKKKKEKTDNGDAHVTIEDCITESETSDSIKTKRSKKRKLENENVEMHDVTGSCDADDNNDSHIKKKKKKKISEESESTHDVKKEHLESEMEPEGSEVQTSVGKSKKKRKQQVEDGSGDLTNTNEEMKMKEEDHDSQHLKKKKKKKNRDREGESGADSEPEEAEDEGTAKKAKKLTDEGQEDLQEEEDDQVDEENEKTDKKKRARKRNKNKKKNIEKKENDPTSLGLRIISKNEWRRLRNKYLNLQRVKMQALKKHLSRAKFGSNYQSPYPPGENSGQDMKQESKSQNVKQDKTEYIPGVIIHIELAEPLGDVHSFKTNVRAHQGIKYIDANEGDAKVHIRCVSAEIAQKLVAEQPWDNMTLLKGQAENAYWEKIRQDREHKINNKIRANVRGRDKLLKHAERELGKHIKFDD